jgi:hypothetical protein
VQEVLPLPWKEASAEAVNTIAYATRVRYRFGDCGNWRRNNRGKRAHDERYRESIGDGTGKAPR